MSIAFNSEQPNTWRGLDNIQQCSSEGANRIARQSRSTRRRRRESVYLVTFLCQLHPPLLFFFPSPFSPEHLWRGNQASAVFAERPDGHGVTLGTRCPGQLLPRSSTRGGPCRHRRSRCSSSCCCCFCGHNK